MYCGNCGNELDDGAAFCTKCGEKAPDIAADETVVITPAAAASATDETVVIETAEPPEQPAWQPAVIQQTKQMPVTPAPAPAPAAAPAAGGHKKKRTALVVAVACLVVVAIIGITAWLVIGQKMQAKRAPHPISFTIQAEGYNDQCTKIPVSVKGVDFEGNQVDDVAFVDASGSGVELVKGEYDLSFPASPLTPDGVLYNVPTNSYHVAIGEDLEEGVPFDQPDKTPAVFSKSTAYGETDEMIASAYDYAIMDESQADRAEELKAVATRVHGDAVAAEEQRKAAEAARAQKQQAGRYYDCPYYTIDLPDSFDSSYKIDASQVHPMKTQGGLGMGYDVSLRSSSGKVINVAVFTTNWGPQGDFVTRNLGYATDGCNVYIYTASVYAGGGPESESKALMNQISQFITLKH